MAYAVIAWLVMYLAILALAGAAVLACIPHFRVTKVNVSLFIVGAIIGWAITVVNLERFRRPLHWLGTTFPPFVAFAVVLSPALVCGIGMVALKIKLSGFKSGS